VNARLVYVVFAALALGVLVGGFTQWNVRQGGALPPVRFAPPFHPNEAAGDLNREYITVRNAGEVPVDITGWTLSNQSGDVFTFPSGFILPAGNVVSVYSGCGEAEGSILYWCAGKPIWNAQTDRARLRNSEGILLDAFEYAPDRPLQEGCPCSRKS